MKRNKRKEDYEKQERLLMMEFEKKSEDREEKRRLEKKAKRHNPIYERDWNTPGAGGYGSGGYSTSYQDYEERRKREQDPTGMNYESLDNRIKSLRKIESEIKRKLK